MSRQRRATTLVELMMTMSVGSLLMLTAIGLVHQTLTISRQVAQQSNDDRALLRLATLFRQDAHRATEASADSETELRLIEHDDSEIVYRFANNQIVRRHGLASGQVHHEVFALDDKHSVEFQMLDNPDRAAVRVERQTELRNVDPRLELHVVASLNQLPQAERGGEEAQP